MNTQTPKALAPSCIGLRLSLCAGALAGAAAAVPDAKATVVVFTTPIAIPNNIDGVYINLLTGATATAPSAVPGWDFNPWASSNVLSFFWNNTPANSSGGVAATTAGPYLALPSGVVISSASTFSISSAPAQASAFQSSGTHVLGFRFFNEATAAINYGYMMISTSGPSGFPATITSWAFENSGAAFFPLIPEPSSRALLSMGALAFGAAGLRRRRRQRPHLSSQ